MTKGEDLKTNDWDDLPRDRPGGHGVFRVLSIRNLMVLLIYFAIVFWAGRMSVESDLPIYKIIMGVLVGLGLAAFGLWAGLRLTRFAFIGWVFFVTGYMIVTGTTVQGFALPSLPILVGAIVYLSFRRRSTNQDALLWVLEVAAERGMPLAPGVEAFAGQSSGIFRVWAGSLARLLRGGVPLPEAIDALPRIFPPSAALLIRMGAESGDLVAGLREAARARSSRSPALQGIGARLAYLCWVLAMGFGIVSFVLYFIIPKFEAIFKDFGVELPELTILVIMASHVIVDHFYIPFFLFAGSLLYLTAFLFGPAGSGLPLIDRLFPGRHTGLILRVLAVVVESGRPVGPAFHSMARRYPTGWVRKRLAAAGAYAEQGVGWAEALNSVGLLSRGEMGVIEASARAGNPAWAIREMAEVGERRRGYRLQFWSQVLFVLTILALGVVVFVIAVAYFMPLTTLILRLSHFPHLLPPTPVSWRTLP